MTAFAPGSMIGKYQVAGELGRGGMGTVYLARDPGLDREVAIKVMNPRLDGVANALARFTIEARAIAKLDSQHVVRVYDFNPGPDAGQEGAALGSGHFAATAEINPAKLEAAGEAPPYLVMELVRGASLATIIADRGRLSVAEALGYAKQALQGLGAAHALGIIHRDIKPGNIMVTKEGAVKLMDFGLARSLHVDSRLTMDGSLVGSLYYLAPEIARGGKATAQSDLYSLGIALYEMLAGSIPFQGESPFKLIGRIARETPPPVAIHRPDISPSVEAWLAKLLENDPARRFHNADEALAALGQIDLPECGSTSRPSIIAAAAAGVAEGSASGKINLPQAEGINAGDVEAVMERALRLEREGRDMLGQETLLDIAKETGVSPEAVKKALAEHRVASAQRCRRQRVLRYAVPAAVAMLLLGLAIFNYARGVAHARSAYQGTGGQAGSVAVHESPASKAKAIGLNNKWSNSGVSFDSARQVLLASVAASGPDVDCKVECRVGDGSPVGMAASGMVKVQGKGEVFFRTLGNSGRAISVAAAAVDRQRVAVMPFNGPADYSAGVADAIGTRLAQTSAFAMAERLQAERVVGNLKLENTEFFDPATAGKIGKLIGVDFLITGGVQQAPEGFRVSAHCVDAQTGEVLQTSILSGPSRDFFNLQDKLAEELAAKIIQSEVARFVK